MEPSDPGHDADVGVVPADFTVIATGVALRGEREHDKATWSFITTRWVVLLGVPLLASVREVRPLRAPPGVG